MAGRLFEGLRGVDVGHVAGAIGLSPARGGSWGPCPCCGADRRGTDDARGPIGTSGAGGWTCHRCDATGDGAALVLAVATGATSADGAAVARAEALAVDVGLLWPQGPPGAFHRPGGYRHQSASRGAPQGPTSAHPDAIPRRTADELRRPSADEVADVWRRCEPVTIHPAVERCLRDRGWTWVDLQAVVDLDLARALPLTVGELPGWAGYGRSPWTVGGRLILPCFGPAGEIVQLRARWVLPIEDSPAWAVKGDRLRFKEHGGTGITHGGCVYANPAGRAMLAGDGPPAGEVVIAEGWPDFARWSVRAPPGAAVLGVWSGAWTGEIGAALAARIPDGARVDVATDADPAGDAYARSIMQTIGARCRLHRWKAR